MQWAIKPLDTKVNVIKEKKSSLPVKEIMTKFNVGKIQVYDILKAKSYTRYLWQSCSNGSIKWKLRKTGNKYIMKLCGSGL